MVLFLFFFSIIRQRYKFFIKPQNLKSIGTETSFSLSYYAIYGYESFPPYLIFSNASLADMAAKRPRDLIEFAGVYGAGVKKTERFGPVFIESINNFNG